MAREYSSFTEIDQHNFNGENALVLAATFGTDLIIRTLIDKWADKTIRDNYYITVLDYLILQENGVIV